VDAQARSSRRSVIAAGLAAAGGLAAAQLVRPAPAAALAPPVSLGVSDATNQATDLTQVENTTAAGTSLAGHHATDGIGLSGDSSTGTGAVGASSDATASTFAGTSHRNGIYGTAGDTTNVFTNTDEAGVFGFCDISVNSVGVAGQSDDGTGVLGFGATGVFGTGDWGVLGDVVPTSTSIGVYGNLGASGAVQVAPAGVVARSESTSGVALRVMGKAVFSNSGRTHVTASHSSIKVSKAGVTSSSIIIATPATNKAGFYVQSVVATTNAFTIYLNKKVTSTYYVNFLILD